MILMELGPGAPRMVLARAKPARAGRDRARRGRLWLCGARM